MGLTNSQRFETNMKLTAFFAVAAASGINGKAFFNNPIFNPIPDTVNAHQILAEGARAASLQYGKTACVAVSAVTKPLVVPPEVGGIVAGIWYDYMTQYTKQYWDQYNAGYTGSKQQDYRCDEMRKCINLNLECNTSVMTPFVEQAISDATFGGLYGFVKSTVKDVSGEVIGQVARETYNTFIQNEIVQGIPSSNFWPQEAD